MSLNESHLEEAATIRNLRIVRLQGRREVDTEFEKATKELKKLPSQAKIRKPKP